MKGKPAFFAALLVLFAGFSADAAITFIYPSPKTLVKRSDYLILKMNNPQISGIKVTVNGLASDTMLIGSAEYKKAFQDLVILQPVWDGGKNEIIVEGYDGEKKIEAASTEIFFIDKPAANVPSQYKRNVMHVPELEKYCSPCHDMNPTTAQLDTNMDKKNPCYGCHKKMGNTNFVHGPAGTFSCAYCHNLKGIPKYAVMLRDAALCNECHADKASEFKKKKFLHGPIEAGMCEICHDPHGSNFTSQLRLPINELCLSCHESVGKETHVVRLTDGAGHPLKDKPDPSKPGSGRDLSCISCHNPHGGEARFFFQNNVEDRMQLCQVCHNK
ncbi:cytochrome c3 family protein [Geotalea toluenoxydans]|uniref:cytochrome c3 family protein n=1 Tax=Geotalea toluenoxydans TaxID=421624 RepID=UPI0006CFD0BA|nr:cytochrome c3 family protein [Geotalea toluenoxydans]